MFTHETVQHCATCDEVTPHSRRTVAVPKVLAVCCSVLAGVWWPAGGILLVPAAFLLLHDRERSWRIRCERCRAKKLAELRRTKPTLDGSTEINLF